MIFWRKPLSTMTTYSFLCCFSCLLPLLIFLLDVPLCLFGTLFLFYMLITIVFLRFSSCNSSWFFMSTPLILYLILNRGLRKLSLHVELEQQSQCMHRTEIKYSNYLTPIHHYLSTADISFYCCFFVLKSVYEN